MPANRDHRERAEELLAGIAADAHTDGEVTAVAGVAEAVLAVADEPQELGTQLTARLPGSAGPLGPPGPLGPRGPLPGGVPPGRFRGAGVIMS